MFELPANADSQTNKQISTKCNGMSHPNRWVDRRFCYAYNSLDRFCLLTYLYVLGLAEFPHSWPLIWNGQMIASHKTDFWYCRKGHSFGNSKTIRHSTKLQLFGRSELEETRLRFSQLWYVHLTFVLASTTLSLSHTLTVNKCVCIWQQATQK